MIIGSHEKDPADTRIYTITWTTFLAASGATITASSWSVPTGLTSGGSAAFTTSATTSPQISGGTHGSDYTVTNTVTLSNGEIKKVKITVQART